MATGFRNFANDIASKQQLGGGVPTFEKFKKEYQPRPKVQSTKRQPGVEEILGNSKAQVINNDSFLQEQNFRDLQEKVKRQRI